MIRAGILALTLGLLCAAPGPPAAAGQAQPAPPGPVVMLASDRPTYAPGTPATFTIAVDNPGNAEATLTFPSGQTYDIAILAGETEVWRWSADRAFIQVIRERPFPPGLSLLGRETWEWRDNAGNPLPPGTYRAVASLATNPPRVGNAVEITLQAP